MQLLMSFQTILVALSTLATVNALPVTVKDIEVHVSSKYSHHHPIIAQRNITVAAGETCDEWGISVQTTTKHDIDFLTPVCHTWVSDASTATDETHSVQLLTTRWNYRYGRCVRWDIKSKQGRVLKPSCRDAVPRQLGDHDHHLDVSYCNDSVPSVVEGVQTGRFNGSILTHDANVDYSRRLDAHGTVKNVKPHCGPRKHVARDIDAGQDVLASDVKTDSADSKMVVQRDVTAEQEVVEPSTNKAPAPLIMVSQRDVNAEQDFLESDIDTSSAHGSLVSQRDIDAEQKSFKSRMDNPPAHQTRDANPSGDHVPEGPTPTTTEEMSPSPANQSLDRRSLRPQWMDAVENDLPPDSPGRIVCTPLQAWYRFKNWLGFKQSEHKLHICDHMVAPPPANSTVPSSNSTTSLKVISTVTHRVSKNARDVVVWRTVFADADTTTTSVPTSTPASAPAHVTATSSIVPARVPARATPTPTTKPKVYINPLTGKPFETEEQASLRVAWVEKATPGDWQRAGRPAEAAEVRRLMHYKAVDERKDRVLAQMKEEMRRIEE